MHILILLRDAFQRKNRAYANFDVGFGALDDLTLFGDFDRFLGTQPLDGGVDVVGDQSLFLGLCLAVC